VAKRDYASKTVAIVNIKDIIVVHPTIPSSFHPEKPEEPGDLNSILTE
jgi:hypothetical protein